MDILCLPCSEMLSLETDDHFTALKLGLAHMKLDILLDNQMGETARLGGGVAPKVVSAGLRCIVSNQDKWYLDHLQVTWEQFYSNEPLVNIADPKQVKLLIGGEVCMWGETVDASDIEQTIWPRAAAAAVVNSRLTFWMFNLHKWPLLTVFSVLNENLEERLWTPFDQIAVDPAQVVFRLANFRCLLNHRGVAAAPLFQDGRGSPPNPGSCYSQ
eukprot:Gb_31945 [translate_table: standard]